MHVTQVNLCPGNLLVKLLRDWQVNVCLSRPRVYLRSLVSCHDFYTRRKLNVWVACVRVVCGPDSAEETEIPPVLQKVTLAVPLADTCHLLT
jgi:hypothetical protein